jgi:hypothetical protein
MVAVDPQVSSGICDCLHRIARLYPSGQLCVLCGGLAGSAANNGVQTVASTSLASRAQHAESVQSVCVSACINTRAAASTWPSILQVVLAIEGICSALAFM